MNWLELLPPLLLVLFAVELVTLFGLEDGEVVVKKPPFAISHGVYKRLRRVVR